MNKFTETVFDTNTSFTFTENGAKTLVTTGSRLVDQFGKAGNYRGRSIIEVFEDQSALWAENQEAALRFPFYLRMVTRKVKVNKNNKTDKVQSGQGARDESFKRLLWIAKEHPEAFYKNIWLLPVIGSWKDMWTLMYYDKHENINVLDKEAMFDVISQGLMSDTHAALVLKYLPRIKSMKKCTTPWTSITNRLAKEFASHNGLSYQEYNKMKASGNAHTFQKLICARRYDELKWDEIPGRALTLLTSGKFLDNHGLTNDYLQWVLNQPVAKFTGYVYELAKKYREARNITRGKNSMLALKHTLDSQFNGLVEQMKKDGTITENVWCCLDTSGSMSTPVGGLNNVMCIDVAVSLALFFAELNTGEFHNKIIMFDDESYPYTITSDSFCDRINNLPRVGCGGTNFQSAVDEIIKIRTQHPEIPLEDYPTTLLVVSDMEFNPVGCSWRGNHKGETTNFEYSKNALKEVFPEDFVDNMKFIWWDVASRYGNNHYEGDGITPGCTFFSGFDGSIISAILGDATVVDESTGKVRQMTAEELVAKALSQEILNYLTL